MNDLGLLLSRIALGAGIAAHGLQKAFGAFEGPGPAGAAQFMQSLGFAPGERFAAAASWTEIGSGALIVLGLGGPVGPAALVSTMVVAQTAVHAKNGFFAQKNGVELGVMYAAGAVALASAGYGRFSLDELLGWHKLREPWLTTAALAGGVVAGWLTLNARQSAPPAAEPAPDSAGSGVARNDSAELAAQALAENDDHLAAAHDNRPVPADLISATEGNAAPQP